MWTTTLEIPGTLGGLPVKGFSFSAFRNYNGMAREIIVPVGVESIDGYPFGGCIHLERIYLPATIVSMSAEEYMDGSELRARTILPTDAKDALVIAPSNSYAYNYARRYGLNCYDSEVYISPEEAAQIHADERRLLASG